MGFYTFQQHQADDTFSLVISILEISFQLGNYVPILSIRFLHPYCIGSPTFSLVDDFLNI